MPELMPMKAQVYKDPRPAEYFQPFHRRARTREPDATYTVVRILASAFCLIGFRARPIDRDNVPSVGPVIVAANHFSYADHFFVACFLRRRVRFMAKSQLFKGIMAQVYSHGGVFPVRRGHRDAEALLTARTILANGGAITMYPEGGRSRTGELAPHARPGVGRLALESGATVVPTAIHGSARVRNWKRGDFPAVTVRYGRPMRWEVVEEPTHEQQQAVADAVFAEIKVLYEELESKGRRAVAREARKSRVRGTDEGLGAPVRPAPPAHPPG
jgi:1-acyl-sn-glycerol-3-phosphate acyltransferase